MAIKVGIGFWANDAYTVDAVTIARAVEDSGFESLWVPDHPAFPTVPEKPYPQTDDGRFPLCLGEMADPFIQIAFMAAATKRIRFGTGVALLTQRHPLVLAKAISTLDQMSGGRIILGVGTGWQRTDTEPFGVPFGRRWAYVRESAQAMKQLWTNGEASFAGEFINFPTMRCDPRPASPGGPPILIGAEGPRALKRAAAWGDGWLPVSASPQAVAEGRKTLERMYREAGRDPKAIDLTVFSVMDLTPETQRAFAEAGATRIVLGLYNHPGTLIPMEQWRSARTKALGTHAGPRPSADETLQVLEKIREQAQL